MTRILTAHQPVYLPWLGLFHKIALADHFVWFDDVQYQTKDWNNRNKIKTQNGPVWLSVPVQRKNHFDIKVRDVLIDNSKPWWKKHYRSIEFAYQKAPYFETYIGFFKDLYNTRWERLSDLNREIFDFFLTCLEISVPITTLTDMNLTETKSELVLAMCKAEQADIYIFGGEGKNYADVDAFTAENITPYFQEYAHPEYTQLHGPFEPYMSVLDLLFNKGPESSSILMSGNLDKTGLIETGSIK